MRIVPRSGVPPRHDKTYPSDPSNHALLSLQRRYQQRQRIFERYSSRGGVFDRDGRTFSVRLRQSANRFLLVDAAFT